MVSSDMAKRGGGLVAASAGNRLAYEYALPTVQKDSGYTATGVDVGDIKDVVDMLKRVAQDIHPLMPLVYEDEPGKKYYFSGGSTFLTGFAAACGYVRNRNNTKALEGALEKLILLLKQASEDHFGLEEYQELIKNITSSRGKMMRRLIYDTFLRFFLGTTTRLEWTDAYRSLSLTYKQLESKLRRKRWREECFSAFTTNGTFGAPML